MTGEIPTVAVLPLNDGGYATSPAARAAVMEGADCVRGILRFAQNDRMAGQNDRTAGQNDRMAGQNDRMAGQNDRMAGQNDGDCAGLSF